MSDQASSSRHASSASPNNGGGPQLYPDLSQITSGMSRTFMNVIHETQRTSLAHSVVGVLLWVFSHIVMLTLKSTQFFLNGMVGRSRNATGAAEANPFAMFGNTPLGLIVKINTWLAAVSLKIISFLLAHFPGHPPTGRADRPHNDPVSALTKLSPDDAEELFFIEKGVQIFYMQPDGSVHSPPQSTSLRVLQFHDPDEQQDSSTGNAVLQVGDWNYPLFPGASPSLSADYGAYIFPNLGEDHPDSCVGIIFDQTVPQEARDTFDRIIKRLTRSQDAPVSQDPSVQQAAAQSEGRQESRAKVVEEHLIRGGEFISDKIAELSDHTRQILRARSERLQGSISPDSRSNFRIHWVLLKSLETANWVAGKARARSARYVDAIGRMTVALARRLTASLLTPVNIFVPSSSRAGGDAAGEGNSSDVGTIGKITQVAKAGILSASNVYVSLENAAITLARNLADETVSVIDVKYGDEAAQAARLGASFLGNSVMTGYNVSNMAIGPKGIARRVIKDTIRGKGYRAMQEEGRDVSPTRRRGGGGNQTGGGGDNNRDVSFGGGDTSNVRYQAGDDSVSMETRKEL